MPGSLDGKLVYNFEGVMSISSAVETFVARMYQDLTELETRFIDLFARVGPQGYGWFGAASNLFEAKRKAWDVAAQALAENVRVVGKHAGDAAVDMSIADVDVANRLVQH
jgi:uncharacterized protein YukE